ncbi:GNAT family N-acetyltransferase [Aerococcaceae bacterium DSM 111020]|nr:GNAT family N-acetyltransferase [Aerococcaceae bacterium DSM 111020]
MSNITNILKSLIKSQRRSDSQLLEEYKDLVRPAPLLEQFQSYINHQEPIYLSVLTSQKAFRIRVGTYRDIPAYLELEKKGYQGVLAWQMRDFIRDFRSNPYRIYLLLTWEHPKTHEEVIAGMISGRFLARKAHISHLIVDPVYQNNGVGQRLLTLWIDLMHKQDIPYCELEVRISNASAIHLYEAYGFKKVQRLHQYYYNNYEDAWKMRRENARDNI